MRFFWNIAFKWVSPSSCTGTSCCNSAADITAGTLFGDSEGLVSQNGPAWTLDTQANCYDYSTTNAWSAQRRTQTQSIITSSKVTAMWSNSPWVTGVVNINNTSDWFLAVVFDLSKRADTGKINTSPVTTMNTYVILSSNCANNISVPIPVSDSDGDVVRCRCNYNLCIFNAVMDNDNCILYFNSTAVGFYAIELILEDFATASSTTPLSSVPLVFLVSVTSGGSATCCADGTNDCRKYNKFFLLNSKYYKTNEFK